MRHGQIIFKESNCTLTLKLGEYSVCTGKYVKHWIMFSPKTGRHCIDTFTNQPDKRVLTHWAGFLSNQNR